jgi:hypothetical protein
LRAGAPKRALYRRLSKSFQANGARLTVALLV